MDKTCHKKTGFPCYIISSQWYRDYLRIVNNLDKFNYMGPFNNFSLINDIFEAHHFSSELDSYKNTYIMPATSLRKLVSKKLYRYLCLSYAGDNQFCPIKRIFNADRTYYRTLNQAVEVIPIAIKCKKQLIVIQLTANDLISQELIPIIMTKFGNGELRHPSSEQASFEIFYNGDKIQKWVGDFNRILLYEQH